MSGMPWLKLYVDDILNDAKTNSLDDGAKWTFIQLLALAGECDAGGAFVMGGKPMPVQIIAWRLGMDATKLAQRIGNLVRAGKLIMDGENVIIADFMEQQGPTQATKREEWRKRQAKHRNTQDIEDTDSRGESKNENKSKEEEEELRVKSKEEEEDQSHVTSRVTEEEKNHPPPPPPASSLPDKTIAYFLEQAAINGKQVTEQLAKVAVENWLMDIQNNISKGGKTWNVENYDAICKRYDFAELANAKNSKPAYSFPEGYEVPSFKGYEYDPMGNKVYIGDDTPDDDDQDDDDYTEVPEKIIRQFENVSATWPIACRTGMKPIYATSDSITIGVSGALRVDVAQAHYGKTLQNAFMKPVVFEVMQ